MLSGFMSYVQIILILVAWILYPKGNSGMLYLHVLEIEELHSTFTVHVDTYTSDSNAM
jgi:hypothetical protein